MVARPPRTGPPQSIGGAESWSQSLIRVLRMPTAPRGATKLAACPTCGKDLTWIPQYDRFYCYAEKKYAPKGYAAAPTTGPAIQLGGAGTEPPVGHSPCPSCGRELTFIAEYDRHYCYAEKKYAPKDLAPVTLEPLAEAAPETPSPVPMATEFPPTAEVTKLAEPRLSGRRPPPATTSAAAP